ncbi:MAG: DUF4394 domain-containing protein [Chthoniobacteraceae bacterium]
MKRTISKLFVALVLAGGIAQAELIVALTPEQTLYTFTSDRPNNLLTAVAISGLQAGEQVLGIDVRPATGELYGLTDGSRLYKINPTTGVASAPVTLSQALTGMRFGIDFNPVPDRLRVVTDTDDNFRIHPDTGVVTVDTTLAYAAGDPSAGANPQIVAAAYTNNDTDPGTLTTLFVLEQELYNSKEIVAGTTVDALSLVRQGGPDGTPSPNLGELTTIGAFGRDGVTVRGFDVGPSGKAFVAVELINLANPTATPFFALVKVLLAPDGATPAGKDESFGHIGSGRQPVRDIAVFSSVQFDTPLVGRREGTPTITLDVSRHGGAAAIATVDYATFNGTASAGQDYFTARGTLVFGVGEVLKTITITLPEDTFAEYDEDFQVFLFNAQNVAIGGANSATVRISANDFPDTRSPIITHFGLTGPSRGITGAVIEFDEDLDPVSAVELSNYQFVGFDRRGKKRPVVFNSAVYDSNRRSVTLSASPFVQTDLKRFTFAVRGKAARGTEPVLTTGVRDFAGNLLDGNANGKGGDNAVLKFAVQSSSKITIRERDGDKGVIEITEGGSIDASTLLGRKRSTQFWILDPIALRSTLNGTVTKSRTGDGIVVIAEIIGLDKKEFAPLLTNPAFRTSVLTVSTNATGISGR